MLGLILIYWIGKYFYKLADEFDKSKWGFAIVGIITYYGGTIAFAFLVGIIMELSSPGFIDSYNETLFGVLMIPFGLLSCFLLYKYLQKTWKQNYVNPIDSIDDIGKSEELS